MDQKELRGSKYERSTKAFIPAKQKAFDDIDVDYYGTQIVEDYLDGQENLWHFDEEERKEIKNKKIYPFTKLMKERLRKNLKFQQYPINKRYHDYWEEKTYEKKRKKDKEIISDFKI